MGVKILLLTKHDHHNVDQLFIHLHKLDSVSLTLQESGKTLWLARKQFDGVTSSFGGLKDHLADDATVMNNVHFKCAIFEIQTRSEHSLSMA